MSGSRVKSIIVLVFALITFFGAQAWRPTLHLADTRPKVDLETMFPKTFGDWATDEHMPVQLISPDTQAVIDKIYSQTLSRTYFNTKGDRIMLSVAYGGDQSEGTRAHRPEVCYPAQGFQILSSQNGEFMAGTHTIRVHHLVAKAGGRVEPISYWVMVGNRVALSGTEQKLAQLTYSSRGLIPDGMLVRVSNIDADAPKAYLLHQGFVAAMAHAIRPDLQAQVIGKAGA